LKEKFEPVTEVHGFRCNQCGKIYSSEEEARRCWDSHTEFEVDYYFSMDHEFPTEVIIKKREGNMITAIGSYELKEVKEVEIYDEKH